MSSETNMSVAQTLDKRQSVKFFDPTVSMSDAEFQQLMKLTLLSPTAFNIQNWRFVRVQEEDKRQKIRAAAWDQPQMTDASELLVLCMDLKAWSREPARYWQHAPAEMIEGMVNNILGYYDDNAKGERDEGLRSCGLAAMSIMLVAQEMGYDSCPMSGFDFDAVGQVINLPHDHEIALIVTIGKAAEAPWPRGGRLSIDDVVLSDSF
ncbi:MAG: nitroreductase [Porticoccaceae bacterium]|jgi:nitroreductase